MNCQQCGEILNEEAKFCTNCGVPISDMEGAPAPRADEETAASMEGIQERTHPTPNKAVEYLYFARRSLLNPVGTASSVSGSSWVFALCSVVAFLIFIPINIYTFLRQVTFEAVYFSFSNWFVQPVLYIAIFLGMLTLILFMFSSVMKSRLTYKEVFSRWGVYMTPAAAIMVLAFPFVLMNIYSLASILFSISYIAFLVSIPAILFTLPYSKITEESKLEFNPFYASVITIILLSLVAYFIGESILGQVISDIMNYSMPGYY